MENLRKVRIYFIGYGLASGSEYYTLEQLEGKESYLELYARSPNGCCVTEERMYPPFMAYGPISPLSISGKPIFSLALDYTEFTSANNLNANISKAERLKSIKYLCPL